MSGVYNFQISLDDRVSSPAKQAASAVSQLSDQIVANKAKIMAQGAAAKQAQDAVRGLAALQRQAAKEEGNALREALQDSKNLFRARAQAAKEQERFDTRLGKKSSGGGGGKGLDRERFAKFGLLGAGTIAFAEAGRALFDLGEAFVGATEKAASFILEAGEARDRMRSLFDAFGEGKVGGDQVINMLDGLTKQVGQTREQLAPLARDFLAMGIKDLPELQHALLATSSVFASLGESGADKLKNLLFKIHEVGEATGGFAKLKGVDSGRLFKGLGFGLEDLAHAFGKPAKEFASLLKNGQISANALTKVIEDVAIGKNATSLQAFAHRLGASTDLLASNFKHLFEDIDPSKFVNAISFISDLFDKDTDSGKAFKSLAESVFGPLFDSAAEASYNLVADLLDIATAIITTKTAFDKTFPNFSYADVLIGGLAVTFGVATAAAIAFGAATVEIWAPIIAIGAAIGGVILLLKKLHDSWDTFNYQDIGANIVNGIFLGIQNGTYAVIDGIKTLSGKMLTAFKEFWHIASPSKVTMALGMNVAQGFDDGYDAEATRAGSVAKITTDGFKSSSSVGTGGSASGGRSINVHAEFKFTGGDVKAVAEHLTEEAISLIFERVALTQGL